MGEATCGHLVLRARSFFLLDGTKRALPFGPLGKCYEGPGIMVVVGHVLCSLAAEGAYPLRGPALLET